METERQQRLNEVARIAVALESQTGCPAQLMIAQWAVESQWGAKPAGHAGYFGIKKAERHEKCCSVVTHEFVNGRRIEQNLEFADYNSLADSCKDYAWLITQGAPYVDAWHAYQASHDLHGLIGAVAARYSTSPSYAALVAAIAGQSNVAQAIGGAHQTA